VAAVTGDNSVAHGDEEEIDVHEGNVAQILHQKGIANVSADDAGDHMTSRRNTRLRINAIHTIRHVPSTANNDNVRTILKTKRNSGEAKNYGMAELDSRADTCCAGKDFIVLEDANTTCEVHQYHPKYKPVTNVPVVKAATAYDYNGTTYILILNQALYFGDDMPKSLLNPNQIRLNGVTVDDCPTHSSPNKDSTHSIYFPEEDMRPSLQLNGIISFLSIRKPSKREIETCTWLELTSDEEWDPYANTFAENESKYISTHIDYVLSRQKNTDERYLYSISTAFDTENVTSHPVINTSTMSSTVKKGINAGNLAQLWGIGIQSAEATLSATTQKTIRSSINPIERRYRTMQQQLRYRQLGGTGGRFYSDTFFSMRKSVNKKSCCQIFVNNVGFYHITPMECESQASEALVEFIQHVGIPNHLHTDGAKTQTLGEW